MTNRGEWMRKKVPKAHFNIKIHVAVDIKTKQVVSLEVSDERTDDGEKLVPLVRKARRKAKVQRVLGDGGYDTHDNFKFLATEGIEARQGSKCGRILIRTAVGQGERWCGPTSKILQGGRSV